VATIKYYVKPQRLYRYRSLREFDREIAAIKGGHLYCAPYKDLNDPMEGLFSSRRLLRQNEEYREIRRAIRENKAQIGMCSFSEVHDHELMWAHYADQFRGICVAYSLSQLLTNLDRNVSFVRMYYNEMVPIVNLTDKEPGHMAKKVLSYKNYRWLYEREWRMFGPLGKADYGKAGCATRVYLGSRIDSDYRDRIIAEMNRLGIETHDMSIDKYSISFEPCS
jgi:Protein of unknown function (DUF2971)